MKTSDPADVLGAAEPGERPANHEAPVANRERPDPREELEHDGESLPAAGPRLSPVDRHAGERPVGVERDRDRERPRVRGPRVRELQCDEGEERSGGRVPAPPPVPLEDGPRLAPTELEDPHGAVRDRAPRAESAPDVAEEDREERYSQPEDDVDERRREVEELGRGPQERRRECDDEHADRDELQYDAQRGREEERAERMRQRTSVRVCLEERALPEGTEQNERDDEDDRRRREEEGLRDRQVTYPADPVSQEDHGLTVRSAIWTPRLSSSTSNRPGIVAVNGSRAVPPAVTSVDLS